MTLKTGTAWSLRKIQVCGDVSVGVATNANIITKVRGGCIPGKMISFSGLATKAS